MSTEHMNWKVDAKVEKWSPETLEELGFNRAYVDPSELKDVKPDEVVDAPGNLLLNEGITRLLNLLIGAGGTAYNNASARIGVGNSTTAAVATQTALQGGSTAFKAMDTSYPAVAGQTVTFKSTFQDGEANFAWNEWTVDNGSTANENLNRKVVSLGTKSGGVWALTVSVTIS